MEELQKRIDALKRERDILQYLQQRLGRNHSKDVAHILAMGRPSNCPEDHMQRWQAIEAAKPFLQVLEEKPKVYDLYYTTSDKLTGEDYMFWNYLPMWIDFMFTRP